MEPTQEAELIRQVAETHTIVQEKVVPQLEQINGTVAEVVAAQNKQDGALGMLRWVVLTGIAVGGLVGGYVFTQADSHLPVQIEIVQPADQQEGR